MVQEPVGGGGEKNIPNGKSERGRKKEKEVEEEKKGEKTNLDQHLNK